MIAAAAGGDGLFEAFGFKATFISFAPLHENRQFTKHPDYRRFMRPPH